MQQKQNKVPSTIAGAPPKRKMSTSNHMGWERVYLEQLHALRLAERRIYKELLGILDHITSENPEFQEKKKERDVISKEIQEVEIKVEYHRVAQIKKGEDEK